MKIIYKYQKATNNYVATDEKGNIVKTVPVGTIIDSVNGRCRLGSNGKIEYLTRESPNIDRALNNLWYFENPTNKGYDPAIGLYYPFTTANGNHDVACGIDLDQNPQYRAEANRGISRERANQIARQRFEPTLEKID